MGPPVSGIAMETHHVFVYKGLLDMSVKEVNKFYSQSCVNQSQHSLFCSSGMKVDDQNMMK